MSLKFGRSRGSLAHRAVSAGIAALLFSGCMDSGLTNYHVIERGGFTMADDDLFLFGEHGYDEECIDNCSDESTRNHIYRLYSMRASTGGKTLLASDSASRMASV